MCWLSAFHFPRLRLLILKGPTSIDSSRKPHVLSWHLSEIWFIVYFQFRLSEKYAIVWCGSKWLAHSITPQAFFATLGCSVFYILNIKAQTATFYCVPYLPSLHYIQGTVCKFPIHFLLSCGEDTIAFLASCYPLLEREKRFFWIVVLSLLYISCYFLSLFLY